MSARKRAPEYLLVVTEGGHGKRIPISAIPKTKRDRQGVTVCPVPVAGAVVVSITDEVVIATRRAQIERIAAADVPVKDRRARGVRLVSLQPGDQVAQVAIAPAIAPLLHPGGRSRTPAPDGGLGVPEMPDGPSPLSQQRPTQQEGKHP